MEKLENKNQKIENECGRSQLPTRNFRLGAHSGFTLIEMLVSIAIFMVVAVIAVAALFKIVDSDRKSQTLQTAVNNINFALDSITRELRVGGDYNGLSGSYSGSGVTSQGSASFSDTNDSSGTSITFLSTKSVSDGAGGMCNLTYSYFIAPVVGSSSTTWTIEKAQQSTSGVCQDSIGGSTALYVPIIDPSIVITNYTVKVNLATGDQPSIFLYVSGYTGATANTQTYFDVQTTISERT